MGRATPTERLLGTRRKRPQSSQGTFIRGQWTASHRPIWKNPYDDH